MLGLYSSTLSSLLTTELFCERSVVVCWAVTIIIILILTFFVVEIPEHGPPVGTPTGVGWPLRWRALQSRGGPGRLE